MLRVALIDDVRRMHAAAFEFLARDEADHTVVLNALALALRDLDEAGPPRGDPLRMALATEADRPVALGLRSQGTLLLAGERKAPLRAIAAALRDDASIRGVMGRADAALVSARGWGRGFREHMRLWLFVLVQEPDPGTAAGTMRLATPADLDLLVAWQDAFEAEARIVRRAGDTRESVMRRIAQVRGLVWCDGEGGLVCHAGVAVIPPSAARIGPVYTPPGQRGRGYAQALVAHACMRLRVGGAHSILLFTDATNPISNSVYQRVGFRFVSEHLHLEFDPP